MKIEVNVRKRYFFLILGAILILGAVIGAYAFSANGVGGNPAVFGHSAGEIEGVCRTDGTGCPAGLGGQCH